MKQISNQDLQPELIPYPYSDLVDWIDTLLRVAAICD